MKKRKHLIQKLTLVISLQDGALHELTHPDPDIYAFAVR